MRQRMEVMVWGGIPCQREPYIPIALSICRHARQCGSGGADLPAPGHQRPAHHRASRPGRVACGAAAPSPAYIVSARVPASLSLTGLTARLYRACGRAGAHRLPRPRRRGSARPAKTRLRQPARHQQRLRWRRRGRRRQRPRVSSLRLSGTAPALFALALPALALESGGAGATPAR